jgi:hypothetical protein
MADREAATFIKIKGRPVQRDSCVPEVSHQFHFSGVVPDVGRDCPAWANSTSHLRNGTRRLRNEIEHQSSDGNVKHLRTCG